MPMKMVALNAYEKDGSGRLGKWLLSTPMKMMAVNTYESDGFERL